MDPGGVARSRVRRVCRVLRVRRVRSVYAAVIPSRCAGRRRQRLTLPAVERPRTSSEVSPASEVLECCVGITGDELGVQRGENQLLIFPFDTHQLPLTDTARLTDFKDGQSTKDKPGGWKVWMKRNEGICLDILRNFLLQMQKQFYNISFPYKENSSALQCRSLAGNRTMLHLLLEGLEMWQRCRSMRRVNWTGFQMETLHRITKCPHLFWLPMNQILTEPWPGTMSSLTRILSKACSSHWPLSNPCELLSQCSTATGNYFDKTAANKHSQKTKQKLERSQEWKQQTHATLAASGNLFPFVTAAPIILRSRNSWRKMLPVSTLNKPLSLYNSVEKMKGSSLHFSQTFPQLFTNSMRNKNSLMLQPWTKKIKIFTNAKSKLNWDYRTWEAPNLAFPLHDY